MWDWRVRQGRPRIWLDDARMALLREKIRGKSAEEIEAMAGTSEPGLALTYLLTGNKDAGRLVIERTWQHGEKNGWQHMRTPALCYDWCHDLLSREEKARFRALFVEECCKRIAMRNVWRSFHFTMYKEAFNIGICAIALDPGDNFAGYILDFLKDRYRDAMHVFEEVFPDGEWPEGFDLKRGATGRALELLWALKTSTGDDLMATSSHMRNSVQYIIHCSKPDGLVYPGGDNDFPHLHDRDREMLLMLAAEFRDPYAQYFLNHCPSKTFLPNRQIIWKDLLWHDPSIPERPLDDIPRSRIFRGHGLIAARSAWGWDEEGRRLPASWVTFRCGRYFGQDTHYDNNHFEIYYKGELAIDSGRDDDDWGMERSASEVRKSQLFNYYRRSIAHNTILVEDNEEQAEMGVVSDGGQKELLYLDGVRNEPENFDMKEYLLEEKRMCHDWVATPGRWDAGEMLAYTGNNLFTYACGDATKAYSSQKMERFVRHFLFVHGDLVVVFDRVVATDPTYRKTWLLHSITQPRPRPDGAFEVAYNGGRLVCVPVLPEERRIEVVGGVGKEFLVGGIRYACGMKGSGRRKSPLHFGELPGAWRIEQCPSVPSEEDYFLNVFLLTDKGSTAVPEVTRIDDDARIGVAVVLPYQRRVSVSFARGASPSARLLIEERGSALFNDALPTTVVLEKGRIG